MSLANLIIYGDKGQLAEQLRTISELDFVDEYGYTPLIQAAIVNDISKVRLILKKGAQIDFPDLTGRTALHWAVDNNNIELCELLLESRANPNAYTLASVPVLVKPMLKGDSELKNLLCRHGADLTFAQDYVNAKLLGHRFELTGFVDLVDNEGRFTELSYEGFVLEFTLDVISQSLKQFMGNFAARHLESQFCFIENVVDSLHASRELIKLQNYLVDVDSCVSQVNRLLRQNPLVIPIVQEGHAITLIRYQNLLAICDRSQKDDPSKHTVTIYYMNRPARLKHALLKQIMYSRKTLEFVESHVIAELGLQKLSYINIPQQLTGNCSWANVEACMPTLMVLMAVHHASSQSEIKKHEKVALAIYRDWQQWDKERAVQFGLQSLPGAQPARKASKLTVLGAVLFQSLIAENTHDMRLAEKIIPWLKSPGYEYILKSYQEVYCQNSRTPLGDNLRDLLRYSSDDIDDFEQVG